MSLYDQPGWLSENFNGVEKERIEFRKVSLWKNSICCQGIVLRIDLTTIL